MLPVDLPVNEILCGDARALLAELPDECVQLVITSPPYFQQRDYGGMSGEIGSETRIEDYLNALLAIMDECARVVRPQGSIVVNLGDKYLESSLQLIPYRFAIEVPYRLPLKLVNTITWVKRNPTPRQYKRRLVSSTEPFFHFVKQDDYFYNYDAFLQNDDSPDKRPAQNGKVGQSYFALIERSQLNDAQKSMARAALYEVIAEVQAGKIEGFRMKIRGLHSEPFGGQAGGRQIQLEKNGFTIIRIFGNPMKRDVIEMPVESLKGSKHPAIYPVGLVKEFLHLLTQPGDLVLDPFIGSGSTAVACKALKRHYLGFELNPAYCEAARARLEETCADLVLI